MSLVKFIFLRILTLLPVLFGVLILTFVLTRLMPGDPVLAFLPHQHSPEQYAEMRARLGLDQPIIIQFFIYIGNIFQGNWGYSVAISPDEPVWQLVEERFPRTLDIAVFSIILATYIG